MPFKQFDRSRLTLRPLAERKHDIGRDRLFFPDSPYERCHHPALPALAQRILTARENDRAVILMLGAHVLRHGAAPLLIDLMHRRLVTHIALNGAGAIHDYELALIGRPAESVARYVSSGEFGLWRETGGINAAAQAAGRDGIGLGEAIGRKIVAERFPYAGTSVLAAGCRLNVPVTVHVSIGQDIVHEHPDCDGGATGAASYADFLVFAESVCNLEGGVLLSIGTAVMGPEVYLKALAMARNVAHQEGRVIPPFHDRRVRPAAARRRQAARRSAANRSPLLLPSLQDDPRADGCGRRRQLLRARGSPADRADPLPPGPRGAWRLCRRVVRSLVDAERLRQIVDRFRACRIAVLGDFFLDKDLDVDSQLAETSLETGKTAHQVVSVRCRPGAAGTVVNNLAALGAGAVHALGFTGDDGEGHELRKALRQLRCDVGGLLAVADCFTSTYLKPRDWRTPDLSGEHERYDTKNRKPVPVDTQDAVLAHLARLLDDLDAVIVLDQVEDADCGIVTQRVRAGIGELAAANPRIVFWADSRCRIGLFRHVMVKVNAAEAAREVFANARDGAHEPEKMAGTILPPGNPGRSFPTSGAIREAVAELGGRAGKPVFVTAGARGIWVGDPAPTLVPGVRVEEPTDPTGAGDSATAGAVLALCAGATPREAALVANLVASITIQQLATTGTASPSELEPRLALWRRQNQV